MPRRGLQPWLRTVTVWLKDRVRSERSTVLRKERGQIVLSREPSTHPAWTGQRTLVESEDGVQAVPEEFGFEGQKAGSLIRSWAHRRKRSTTTTTASSSRRLLALTHAAHSSRRKKREVQMGTNKSLF